MSTFKKISKTVSVALAVFSAIPAISYADNPGAVEAYNSASDERRNIVGMEISNLTPEQRAATMFTGEGGVYVSAVIENHPAALAGLQAEDIIVKINGTPVKYVSDAIEVMNDLEAGRNYDFEVQRKDPATSGVYTKKLSILVEKVQERAIGKIS